MSFRPKQFIQRQFREGLKKEILSEGLYETGTLYESIDVNVTIDEVGLMTIEVFSVDYLKYLWDRFNLADFAYRGGYVEQAYRQWMGYKIEQNPMLNWNLTAPKIIFRLNDL